MNVAFLTNVISPYRAPVFRTLAATPGWRFRVLVNATTEFDRRWDGDCDGVEVIASRTWRFKRAHVSHEPVRTEQIVTTHLPIGLWRDLSRFAPDAVVTHELGPRSLLASLWCRAHRRPYVVWSYQSRAMGSARGRLRTAVRRTILDHAAAIVGMGCQAREVLEATGVPAPRIIDAPNATDVALVLGRLLEQRADGTVDELRATLSKGKRVALFCGRLVPFKGLRELLDAWTALPAQLHSTWRLVVVGDGPLATLVEAAGKHADIAHLPAVPMRDVPAHYAAADLHVFPSLADAWGLSVQEAMLCGVPTLCSIHAGCADELVTDGVDGIRFDPSSPDTMRASLVAALQRQDLSILGERAASTARAFTPQRLAESFRIAVGRAVEGRLADFGATAPRSRGLSP